MLQNTPKQSAATDAPLYDVVARAFHAEGVRVHFTLMGDGNMHWATALAALPDVRTYHVRHEHCAVAMASSYAAFTGEIGVASVTCGPGLTQVMTALPAAVRARIPLVIFTGESPINSAWYNQSIDQAPFIAATGARYIQAHSLPLMLSHVREAFRLARVEQRPVVIGIPYDMQKKPLPSPAEYVPSDRFIPDTGRMQAPPDHVARAAAMIGAAKRVIVLGGRGAKSSVAAPECIELADRCGGLLAETLPVRGLFSAHDYDLGIAGGFATDLTKEMFRASDLVVAVGASLTYHTIQNGRLFPDAKVIQIDADPVGVNQGNKVADLYIRADAKAGVRSVLNVLEERKSMTPGWRSPELIRRLETDPPDSHVFEDVPGKLDPRDVVAALDKALPKDWVMVNASGHCSYFTAQMRGRSADNFLTIREFGAIGNGLSYAIGVAAATPDKTVVLMDGDGGLLMHVQELETVRRHGIRILMCILNDGAYGSEIHKLRADHLSDEGAVFGYGDLSSITKGFGLNAHKVSDLAALGEMAARFQASKVAELWDFQVSDKVMSPVMRAAVQSKH
jgi:thiamine pyrophosphate-dependent acetolactate synthase large subunit-like protein